MHQDSPDKKHLHVKISEVLYRKIELAAERKAMIPSDIVREALEHEMSYIELSVRDMGIVEERIKRNIQRIAGHAE